MKAYFLQGTILCQAIILNAKLHAAAADAADVGTTP